MNWVYKIIEKNTGNFYIGSSKNIDRREKEHLNELLEVREVEDLILKQK